MTILAAREKSIRQAEHNTNNVHNMYVCVRMESNDGAHFSH